MRNRKSGDCDNRDVYAASGFLRQSDMRRIHIFRNNGDTDREIKIGGMILWTKKEPLPAWLS